MEHPAPLGGGKLYHQDAGHKMKAPSKGNLASLRPAKFIPFRRHAQAGYAINLPKRMVPPHVLCAPVRAL